ncbi:protein VACUOLELESS GAMETOPHYTES-like [Lycium ferocissimum]|uniref:protein VACUOLELESS GAMETOPHYTES-like n=1 Tax=Lycium ferocissimum TaxID=112874 RepID=UPI002814B556|nr:protein VACUOLELESS GAMETOPHYTES-like [Lycium ferocissimum]
MAILLTNTMRHFTHPKHPITLHDDTINPKYLCEGCMTYGSGKRYYCHDCTFNLHEYCATCPRNLSSFMHPHHLLTLVGRDHLPDRVCKVCCDPIEGLSYRCALCEFNVHPICTLLPDTLKHILHQRHPLRLLGSSQPAGNCAVCREACDASSWRYRCALCEFDIHIGCVTVQCINTSTHRGIPTYVPPYVFPQQQYLGGYAYWNPSPNTFPGPSNMHHYNYNTPQPQLHQQHQGPGQAQTHNGGSGGRIRQVMFDLVKAIAIGVVSNMIFGVDVSPFFAF